MADLIYYTVGFNKSYIGVLSLSISSLRKSGYMGDILVICDESFLDECKSRLQYGNILYKTFPDSKTPEQASINKLRVFEYESIGKYNRIFFLDSDILVHMNIGTLFKRITNPNVLYVYTESTRQELHTDLQWSLQNHTNADLVYFKSNNIHVFNAGCFAFIQSPVMKEHFVQILRLISQHTGRFFYEQSFMNVYFNRNNQTDRTLLTDENYIFPPKNNRSHPNCLLHFAGDPGSGHTKFQRMNYYMTTYF